MKIRSAYDLTFYFQLINRRNILMTTPTTVAVSYPFDATGILLTNKIVDEQHAVNENNFRDFYFIVPKFAPFFADNLKIIHTYQGVSKTLIENLDYYCALMMVGATRAIGKAVYGAVTLNNLNTSGVLSFTYNTIGGDWNIDQQYVVQQIAEKAYNPRTVSWEHIVAAPTVFPPIPHAWDLVDLVGEKEVVDSLNGIEQAIVNGSQTLAATHLSNFLNPHQVTKDQIGLGNLGNWARATDVQVADGASIDTLITPASLKTVLSLYYTKAQVDSLIAAAVVTAQNNTNAALTNLLAKIATSKAKNYFLAQI
jgi:hypothetical protein